MSVLLFLILFILLFLNIQIVKDFFHPTVIFKLVWFISVSILIFFEEKWGVSLSGVTITLFLIGFLFFDLGFLFFYLVRKISSRKINKLNNKVPTRTYIKKFRKQNHYLLFIVIILTSLYLVFDITRLVGINTLFSDTFFIDYREMKYDGSDSTNIQQFLFRIIEVLGMSCVIFFFREPNKNLAKKVMYIFIISIPFGIQILTTGRMRFLAILVQIGVITLIHMRKRGKYIKFSSQFKFVKKAAIMGFVFISVFYLYGKFAVDKIDAEDPLNSIAIYTSSSLPAFDMTWESKSNTSEYFGETLFGPIYNLFEKIFRLELGQGDNENITDPFVSGDNGFSTNVYTLYDKQVLDFGPLAIPIVMFSIGIFMSFLKYKSENEHTISFWTALYSMFIFSLIISFFQDTFFINSTFMYISIVAYIIVFKTNIFKSSIK